MKDWQHLRDGNRLLSDESWFWPTWLYLAANCSPAPSHDAPLGREAAEKLFAHGSSEPALLCVLFSTYCYAKASQWSNASELVDWAWSQGVAHRQGSRERLIWDLIDQVQAYWVYRGGLEKRLGSVEARPNLFVSPVDVSRVPDLIDQEAASAAIAWMVLESLDRIVSSLPATERRYRPLTVDEDLALRFSGNRVCGIHMDPTFEREGLRFKLPEYLRRMFEGKSAFFHAYLTSQSSSIELSYADLQVEGKVSHTTVRREAAIPRAGEVLLFEDVPGLALDAAQGMLKGLGINLPTPQPDWLVFPRGDRSFQVLVEAAGFEARGNFLMAARRYQEILHIVPDNTPGTQLRFVQNRLQRCQDIAAFDDPERFLDTNDGALRTVLRTLVR